MSWPELDPYDLDPAARVGDADARQDRAMLDRLGQGEATRMLRAVLALVERGELTAPPSMAGRLYGALDALDAVDRPPAGKPPNSDDSGLP